jgi:hypothetical protein
MCGDDGSLGMNDELSVIASRVTQYIVYCAGKE